VPAVQQLYNRVGADVANTTGNQNFGGHGEMVILSKFRGAPKKWRGKCNTAWKAARAHEGR
jgi:hypothetical protein